MSRLSSIAVSTLALYFGPGHAVSDAPVNGLVTDTAQQKLKLEQKLKLAIYLFRQISLSEHFQRSDDQIALDLLSRAESNIEQTQLFMGDARWLEAGAVVEFALRDLSAASQLLKNSDRARKRYQQALTKLDSFVLPAWSDLSESEIQTLHQETEKIRGMKLEAVQKAQALRHAESVELLEQAYAIKAGLITRFKHHKTVVYDQNFSEDEEYLFLIDRNQHYLELIEIVRKQKEASEQVNKLADRFIYEATVDIELATNMGAEKKYSDAIPILKRSVKKLISVLKVFGIKV